MRLQKLGGWAAILWVCAVVVLVATSPPGLGSGIDPAKLLAAYQAWPVVGPIGILEGILSLIVILSLAERMQAKAPTLMRFAVIGASIFAALSITESIVVISSSSSIAPLNDISANRALGAMLAGLNTAEFHAWGWALLLTGCAALRTRSLPKIPGYLILAYGIVAIPQFAVTQLEYLRGGLLFPLSMICLGIVLIRNPKLLSA